MNKELIAEIEAELESTSGMTVDYMDFLERLKAELSKGWVPVSERLPENDDGILCWIKNPSDGSEWADILSRNSFEWGYVTHWQPIEPPHDL